MWAYPGVLPGLHDDPGVGRDVLAQDTARLSVLLHYSADTPLGTQQIKKSAQI